MEAETKSEAGDGMIDLNIKVMNGDDIKVQMHASATVLHLKEEIERKLSVEPAHQRLIFCGKVLEDTRTLDDYGIQTGHSVHFVRRARPGGASSGGGGGGRAGQGFEPPRQISSAINSMHTTSLASSRRGSQIV
mmetsp:Transcript_41328/g.67766  ORF Transcript_41328/g.67766 Transcript_41328/m.67766 type:complete len:134 (+) Transcript_41328:178-579(+)